MTIKEKATAYFDRVKEYSTHPEQYEKMRDIVEIIYVEAANETLASLLDELPEEEKYIAKDIVAGASRDGHNACLKKIKSLIQNKLK